MEMIGPHNRTLDFSLSHHPNLVYLMEYRRAIVQILVFSLTSLFKRGRYFVAPTCCSGKRKPILPLIASEY